MININYIKNFSTLTITENTGLSSSRTWCPTLAYFNNLTPFKLYDFFVGASSNLLNDANTNIKLINSYFVQYMRERVRIGGQLQYDRTLW